LDARARVVEFDLVQAAKDRSKRGLEILVECMEDTGADWNTRLKAIELLFERGYGRAQIQAVIETNHRFVVAPQVMPLDQWLNRLHWRIRTSVRPAIFLANLSPMSSSRRASIGHRATATSERA
jgi:hypothetical protein